jgi:hypothetical protein
MKKLIVSALALTLISFASVEASTTAETRKTETATLAASTQEKVAVKPEDLPEGIKKTIKGEEFSGWKVTKAFLVTEEDKSQYYELQVAKGDESARVKLDKDGNNVG